MIIALVLVIAIILLKYKPAYKISISGITLGYLEENQDLEQILKEKMSEESNKNIDNIMLKEEPEYELKLINRTENTEDIKLTSEIKDDIIVTYKFYEIAIEDTVIEKVNTSEEAENLVEEIKNTASNQIADSQINLNIVEKYTQNEEEVQTNEISIAMTDLHEKASKTIEDVAAEKEEEERINSLPTINGIKLAVTPIQGTITSRYGVSSRIRVSTHTGLDIAAVTGTDIKVVADGTVISACYDGSYGNLVKVDHGNGVETWYAHTSKMYVKPGQKVTAGEVIAAVGSTGNSTGPHLHLEIRIDGQHVNPQDYLYK